MARQAVPQGGWRCVGRICLGRFEGQGSWWGDVLQGFSLWIQAIYMNVCIYHIMYVCSTYYYIRIYIYIYIFAQFKNNHIHEPYHAKALGCRWLQSLLWLPLEPWMVNAQSSVFFGSSTLHYSVNFLEATNFRITFNLSYVSSLRLKQHQENQERAGYHKGWPLWTLPPSGILCPSCWESPWGPGGLNSRLHGHIETSAWDVDSQISTPKLQDTSGCTSCFGPPYLNLHWFHLPGIYLLNLKCILFQWARSVWHKNMNAANYPTPPWASDCLSRQSTCCFDTLPVVFCTSQHRSSKMSNVMKYHEVLHHHHHHHHHHQQTSFKYPTIIYPLPNLPGIFFVS